MRNGIKRGRKMYILDYEALKLAKIRERELIRQAAVFRLIKRSRAERSRKKHDLSRLENTSRKPDIYSVAPEHECTSRARRPA
jgi:hypothetical protein